MQAPDYVGPEYLSCAETAKLLRVQLKRAFPGIKFSVRSSTYAGGASSRVGWTDGATSAAVDRVCAPFRGGDFDGMIDLKTYNHHWLEPDGSSTLAYAEGTEGSRGYLPKQYGDPPSPNSRLVSYGADFVFAERDVSAEWTAEILDHFEAVLGRELPRDLREQWGYEVPLYVDRD